MAKTLAEYQADIDKATAALVVATANKDAAYGSAKIVHESLFKCVAGKGTTSNCPDGQPLGSSGYPSFGAVALTQNCKICNSAKNCETDCCKEDTCVSRMNDYNTKVSYYNNTAIPAYNTAVANLKIANDAKALAIATDPGIKEEQDNRDADEANRKTRNFIIIAVVLATIAGVGYWLYKKYGK